MPGLSKGWLRRFFNKTVFFSMHQILGYKAKNNPTYFCMWPLEFWRVVYWGWAHKKTHNPSMISMNFVSHDLFCQLWSTFNKSSPCETKTIKYQQSPYFPTHQWFTPLTTSHKFTNKKPNFDAYLAGCCPSNLEISLL